MGLQAKYQPTENYGPDGKTSRWAHPRDRHPNESSPIKAIFGNIWQAAHPVWVLRVDTSQDKDSTSPAKARDKHVSETLVLSHEIYIRTLLQAELRKES